MKRSALILCILICCLALLPGCTSPKTDATKQPLKVLAIGNSYSRDCMYYLSSLAALDGYTIESAYLDAENATLRDHAHNLTFYSQVYTFWRSGDDGTMASHGTTSIGDALEQYTWDVIILQHHPYAAGFPTTYNSDLEYLLDYLSKKTDAKIYWNMPWAMEDGKREDAYAAGFATYYDNSQALMYNAIVDCIDKYIAGPSATFKDSLDGFIPTGTAIQNLRGTLSHDKSLTRNGANLSFDIGRLCASMTLVKTLLPEYDTSRIIPESVANFLNTSKYDSAIGETDSSSYVYEESHLVLAVDAVNAACQLTPLPTKLNTDLAPTSSNADITPLQLTAPMKAYFPDAATLSDGTVIIGVYENVSHKPDIGLGDAQACGGRLVVFRSRDNGATWDYDAPLLIVDESQMEAWGLSKTSDRFSSISAGRFDYPISIDPRDPNFGIVNTDLTGDGVIDEVLLFTFWVRIRMETLTGIKATNKGYLCWSTDGGNTWSEPQQLQRSTPTIPVLKRGNIASFSNRQILIPCYSSNTAAGLLMEYSIEQGKWILLKDSIVLNYSPSESENFNEVSFVAPDPDSDTVFAYCRDNGTVLKSEDRGSSWILIGNEPGLIHQPGFAVIDTDRVFTTWALPKRPRNTYGKVFYVNGDWKDTQAQLIYESSDPILHDMADPSCILLADGRILTVSYDTAYRSIVGVYIDLTDSKWLPK